ncbi:unnamed protein product [Scytosiphon promiscuus]
MGEGEEGYRTRGRSLSPLGGSRRPPIAPEPASNVDGSGGRGGFDAGAGMTKSDEGEQSPAAEAAAAAAAVVTAATAAEDEFLTWEDVLAGSPNPELNEHDGLEEVRMPDDDLVEMGGIELGAVSGGGAPGSDVDAATAAAAAGSGTAAIGAGAERLSGHERARCVSDSAMGRVGRSSGGGGGGGGGIGELDLSWRPTAIGGGLDRSAFPRERVDDGGSGDRTARKRGRGKGRGRGRGRGRGASHHLELAAQQKELAERGARSVSDCTSSGAPGVPVDSSAAWDVFARGLFTPFPGEALAARSLSDSLPAAAGAAHLPASWYGGVLPQSGGGAAESVGTDGVGGEMGPASLDGVDVSDLLLTPEELFCPPPAGSGMGGADDSNLTMQALGAFNPTLLGSFPQGGYGRSGGGGAFAAPVDRMGGAAAATAAAAAATAGIGGLCSGAWTSVNSSRDLAAMGQQRVATAASAAAAPPTGAAAGLTGEAGAPALHGNAGPNPPSAGAAANPAEGMGPLGAPPSVPYAMDLSLERSDLAGCQLGGAWPMQRDELLWRAVAAPTAGEGSSGGVGAAAGEPSRVDSAVHNLL